MRVLLTGASGYLGTATANLLAVHGIPFVGTDIIPPRATAFQSHAFLRADLTDTDAVRELVVEAQPDVIVHLAGLLSARESMQSPERYLRVNITASLNLMEAMLPTPCRRFLFASTNSVYGIPRAPVVRESDPAIPHTVYGETKLMFERMLAWFQQIKGVNWCALRFFNLAGGDEFSRLAGSWSGALSTRLLAIALGRVPHIDVFGLDHPTPDGSCIRDYLHVDDAAEAVLACLNTPSATGPLNVSGGHRISVLEAIRAFRDASGHDIPMIDRGKRDGDVPEIVADISRAAQALGWRPTRSAILEIAQSAWQSAIAAGAVKS